MANKSKKRHSNSSAAVRNRAQAEAIADQKDRARKRMNPLARNILFGDLVFLAVIGLLEDKGLITALFTDICTIFGALLIPVALYFEFVKKDGGPKGGPRLK
jgi:hypothetical protein